LILLGNYGQGVSSAANQPVEICAAGQFLASRPGKVTEQGAYLGSTTILGGHKSEIRNPKPETNPKE
jgi:hypothetical protein